MTAVDDGGVFVSPRRAGRVWQSSSGLTALLLVGVVILSIGPSVSTPFTWTDSFVLANVGSSSWVDRAFAFDDDRPGPKSPNLGAWWDGITIKLRQIRISPSLFMAAEVALLGQRAVPLHWVSLCLHAMNTLLLYALLVRVLRHTWAALAASLIFASHPVATEPVASWSCQPILFATAFGLGAMLALWRFRQREELKFLALAWALCLLAVTSYEAAVALPLLLCLADRGWVQESTPSYPRRPLVWGGFALAWVVLLGGTVLVRAGIKASSTGFRPTLEEIGCSARTDIPNYVLKALGAFDPHNRTAYWIYNHLGEHVGLFIALATTVFVVRWAYSRPLARLGLFVFTSLLAPPVLIRIFVSSVNHPTLRQLYLPLTGIALMVGVAVASARTLIPFVVSLAVTTGAMGIDWMSAGDFWGRHRREVATSQLAKAALSGVEDRKPVIVLGSFSRVPEGCSYVVPFDWPGRMQWMLVPPTQGKPPEVHPVDDRTFVALAPEGFDIPTTRRERPRVQCSPGRFTPLSVRTDADPPPIVRDGWQMVDGARVEVAGRSGMRITGLRFHLPLSLGSYAFIAAEGCRSVSLVAMR